MPGDNNAIKIEHLSVNYDKTPVLWNIECTIPRGERVAIIGPNGAGKSTLLKAILGMVEPIAGTVQFFGQPLKLMRRSLAYVPQRGSVDWDFPITVFDVVLMGRYGKLGLWKRPTVADKEAVKQVLERVDMLGCANRQISKLSVGQQQRVFIARALVQDADIYLMDEPFAGVDMATEKSLIALFSHLRAKGKTLLVVHHDLTTVHDYFDSVVMLNTCLVAYGPVQETFCQNTIARTYGRGASLFDEVAKLTQNTASGLRSV